MATTYLTRTFGTATNRLICTASMWVKRSALGSAVFWNSYNSGTYRFQFYFDGSDRLGLLNVDSGSNNVELITNRLFRDVNAWYHLVASIDTTQSTASDRVKIYVNGVQETSFATGTYPSQNADMSYGASSYSCQIGRYGGGSDYFSGSMSHIHFIDGTAYNATAFGQYDANGVWTINTSPSVTYGNEGFFILKDGNSVTDQSPNTNNFTVGGGTLTNTEDNPSNVFATFNPLIGLHSNGGALVPNLEAGNTDAWINTTQWRIAQSTLAASSGKYYAEFKQSNDYGTDYAYIGIWDIDAYAQKITGYPLISDMANCFGFRNDTGDIYASGSASSYGSSWTTNDIIGIALDCDNNKLYFSKNGTWQNSANPSNGTGGVSITADKTYAMGLHLYNSAYRVNFGNGYFGTTAVASAGTNASGIGIFEYDVPTGYTALSTKGLNL